MARQSKGARPGRPHEVVEEHRSIHVPTEEPNAAVPDEGAFIELTTVVKKAARTAVEAISAVDFDDLSESRVNQIRVRCASPEVARAIGFLSSVKPRPVEAAAGIVRKDRAITVSVSLNDYLQLDALPLLQDTAEADAASIPVARQLVDELRKFLTAFGDSGILRIELDSGADTSPGELEPTRKLLDTAHKRLVTVVRYLLEAVTDTPPHHVIIEPSGNLDNAPRVLADGSPLTAKNRARRALCVLTLLQDKQPFSVEDFMKLYSGDSSEARKDFNTVARSLRPLLPRFTWTSAQSKRWIKGLRIELRNITRHQVEEFLREFNGQ